MLWQFHIIELVDESYKSKFSIKNFFSILLFIPASKDVCKLSLKSFQTLQKKKKIYIYIYVYIYIYTHYYYYYNSQFVSAGLYVYLLSSPSHLGLPGLNLKGVMGSP